MADSRMPREHTCEPEDEEGADQEIRVLKGNTTKHTVANSCGCPKSLNTRTRAPLHPRYDSLRHHPQNP